MRDIVTRMADDYARTHESGEFAYRILLPRGERLTSKAKRLGLAFQGEFVLALRKRHLVPRIREVRYVHDESHYGWILASREQFERYGLPG